MAMLNRFRHAVQAARAATTINVDASRPVVAALVIGSGPGELAAARAWLRAVPNARAILITDQTDVALFQIPGLVTEFLPTGDWQTANPARNLYVQRRLVLIFTKWAVTRCAGIGPEAEKLVALVSTQAETALDAATVAKAATG